MWIRSQDKKKLVESTNVFITFDNGTYIIKSFIEKYNYFDLGSYSTEEKALSVLDKLERFATDLERYIIEHDMFNDHTTRTVVDNIVFQMPE